MMSIRAFRKLRVLFLAAICAGLPRCLPAQLPSSNLSQPLTNDPITQPVTTLSIDLLAPQRPYIYDPTGSYIFSTALTPYIDTTNVSIVRVQTDTEIRDSSQTGQVSPYANLAARLGVTLPKEAGTGSTASRTDDRFEDAAPAVKDNFGEAPTEENDSSDQTSSWGTSDSFGPRTGGALRGLKASQAARLGLSQPAYSDSEPGGSDSGRVTSGEVRAGSGSQKRKLTGVQPLTMPGTSLTRGASRRSGPSAGSEGTPSSAGPAMASGDVAPTSGEAALLFSPQSYKGYTFGETPFSSPAGSGELTFLNPNIFATGTMRNSSSPEGSSREKRSTLRERLEEQEGLGTSASGYGLGSSHHGMESGRNGKRKDKKSKKNPFLVEDENNPDTQ